MMIPITLFALTLTIVGFGAVGTAAEEEETQVQVDDAGWIWLDDAGWIWLDEEADPAEPATSPDSESQAKAASVVKYLPGYLGRGGVARDGWIYACDMRADGWGVRTYYVTSRGGEDHVGDRNGNKCCCGTEPPFDNSPVISFRVCAGVNGADTVCR